MRPTGSSILEIKPSPRAFRECWRSRCSFDVQTGEVHALVGENGAGKSTLMKILSGVYDDYEGELWEGERLTLRNPRDAQPSIVTIHQELNVIPEFTVAENIFLGSELHTPLGLLDIRRMDREAVESLERFNLAIPPNRPSNGCAWGTAAGRSRQGIGLERAPAYLRRTHFRLE